MYKRQGGALSTITVQLLDITGTPLTVSGGLVEVEITGSAVLGTVVDNNDGTYTVTASNDIAEIVRITAKVNGTEILDTADVIYEIGAQSPVVDPVESIITATSPVEANGSSTSTIIIELFDINGNPLLSLIHI